MILMVGKEALATQGFPVEVYQKAVSMTKDELLTDLGGNAMSAGVLMAIFEALLMAAPWKEMTDISASCQDTTFALSHLNRVLKKKR